MTNLRVAALTDGDLACFCVAILDHKIRVAMTDLKATVDPIPGRCKTVYWRSRKGNFALPCYHA